MKLGTMLAVIGLIVFLFSFAPVHAYSANGVSEGTTFGSFFVPFERFFQSIRSVGNFPPRAIPSPLPPASAGGGLFSTSIQDTFTRFDNWLYGIAGFHISNFFKAILSIFSWLLGAIKSGVDWLLGYLS